MKIRTSFVANSSVSSFCIWGVYLEEDDVTKMIEFAKTKMSNKDKKLLLELNENNEDKTVILRKIWDDEWSIIRLDYCAESELALGLSYSEGRDGETFEQFKQRISDEIKRILGYEKKCQHIEEAYQS